MKICRKTALSKIQLAGVAWRWLARAQAEEVTWMRHLCTTCATCRANHITKKCAICAALHLAINQRVELCSRYTLVPRYFAHCTFYYCCAEHCCDLLPRAALDAADERRGLYGFDALDAPYLVLMLAPPHNFVWL